MELSSHGGLVGIHGRLAAPIFKGGAITIVGGLV